MINTKSIKERKTDIDQQTIINCINILFIYLFIYCESIYIIYNFNTFIYIYFFFTLFMIYSYVKNNVLGLFYIYKDSHLIWINREILK